MLTLITILILLAAIFMILIVLVQKSKGGGLASGFSSTSQIMGVRKTTNFLEKATWTLAATIIVLCIASGKIKSHHSSVPRSKAEIQNSAPTNPVQDPNVAPSLPVPSSETPAEPEKPNE